jgi:small subunit ribosomal protein S3
MGRAYRYQRRTSHITIELGERNNGSEDTSLRIPARITKPWRSRWFAKRDYSRLLHEDLKLKRDLLKQLAHAGVSNIEVERMANKLRITIYTRARNHHRPQGSEIDKLKADIQKRTNREVYINIQEIHRPELDAQLVRGAIAMQLEKRIAFRRAMRKSVDSALRFGAKGIKVRVSGRLNGAEIARSEWYLQGRLPLHTLRADVDYGLRRLHDLRSHRREVLDLQG